MTDTSIPRAEQPIGDTEPVLPAGPPADAETTEAVAVDGESADAGPEQDEEDDDVDGEEDGDQVEKASNGGRPAAATSDADLFRQSEIAADYVEGLLDILDYDGDIDELVSAGRPVVEVVGGRLQALVGQRGATLEALQELTRLAVFRQTGTPSRLLLDVGGYRATRRKELSAVAKNAVEKVKQHGEAVRLEPMSAFERKCVHDVVNAIAGVESESEGVEPNRRIVVRPVD
ncbi:R3H domain-containing nucleic acid-binding protein [Plantactinospora veratri]|uniref:R3H domain-containing nucleic acid-binding protein n=1 Tax=Plantactinospora veratri TaxID=1436122 RepID=A0ABU7SMN1_9ACTN